MYRTEQCYGISKVRRRTIDTGMSLVADEMNAKTYLESAEIQYFRMLQFARYKDKENYSCSMVLPWWICTM